MRPRASWTLKRAIMVNLVRTMGQTYSQTGPFIKVPTHTAITGGKGINGVWIPTASHLVTGELKTWADGAKVTPIRLPGYWYHKKNAAIKVGGPSLPNEKVVLNFHGGAYIRLSAHPNDPTGNIPLGILEAVPSVKRVFSLEYRLSSGKPFKAANPFPTALVDALAGYNYLVNVVGFSPSDIIVCGDSAGGNLAHALTRYLVEYQGSPSSDGRTAVPPPPGALILLSPWVDLSTSHDGHRQASSKMCAKSDYIDTKGNGSVSYAKSSFVGPSLRSILERNPYISPASRSMAFPGASFTGFPRTFIVGGGAEVLIDQIRTFKDRMIKDLGEYGRVVSDGEKGKEREGSVKYYEAPDAVHDYLVFRWHEPERSETLKAIARWVEDKS